MARPCSSRSLFGTQAVGVRTVDGGVAEPGFGEQNCAARPGGGGPPGQDQVDHVEAAGGQQVVDGSIDDRIDPYRDPDPATVFGTGPVS